MMGSSSAASRKAESGATNSPRSVYWRSSHGTRVPSTARIRMFASSTSILALLHAVFAAQPLEVVHEFFLGRSRCGDQLLHLFAGNPKGLDISLARLGPGRQVDADGRAMPRDGDRRLRFQIAGQVLPKLPNSDPGRLHWVSPRFVYTMIPHAEGWLRQETGDVSGGVGGMPAGTRRRERRARQSA